jgi:hypothetical protein
VETLRHLIRELTSNGDAETGVSDPPSDVSYLLHPPALRSKRYAADLWRAGLVVILTLPAHPRNGPRNPPLSLSASSNNWTESCLTLGITITVGLMRCPQQKPHGSSSTKIKIETNPHTSPRPHPTFRGGGVGSQPHHHWAAIAKRFATCLCCVRVHALATMIGTRRPPTLPQHAAHCR